MVSGRDRLRIYPKQKYIITPINGVMFENVKDFVESTMAESIPEKIIQQAYKNIRKNLNTDKVILLGRDEDGLCIYEFDVTVDTTHQLGGYDEYTGVPYLKMLN